MCDRRQRGMSCAAWIVVTSLCAPPGPIIYHGIVVVDSGSCHGCSLCPERAADPHRLTEHVVAWKALVCGIYGRAYAWASSWLHRIFICVL